jgi:superfamily I DNA/RNA helicase
MSDGPPFQSLAIADKDIRWASNLLGLKQGAFHGEDGTDPRQDVLKCMETIDVAACPGSSKTTLLVAKLAILAERWPCCTRGICVLSHTNVARHEIEKRLGNTAIGERLLSYPHLVGTIHGFVNEFLAIPWLRSMGYPVKMINTEICQKRRWSALPFSIKSGLEANGYGVSLLSIKSSDFNVGEIHWGKNRTNISMSTPTYQAIQNVCRQSATEGCFCYDEMFVWAQNLIEKLPQVSNSWRTQNRSLWPQIWSDLSGCSARKRMSRIKWAQQN